jgi:hypothetical protein
MVAQKKNNFWYMFISLLLIILIILVIILIYIYNKPNTVTIIKEVHQIENPKQTNAASATETAEAAEAPVYPTKLPQYYDKNYQQIGILTSNESDKEPIILPLFSRRVNNHKERWNYYTASDNNHMMRLPITFDNMKCEDDIGCREIYDNDTLTIEIYKDRIFRATIYKVESPQYFADKY